MDSGLFVQIQSLCFVIVLTIFQQVDSNSLPKGCKYFKNHIRRDIPQKISCDHLGWKEMQSLPMNITHLSLDHNALRDLPEKLLTYKQLTGLYLAGNKFTTVDDKNVKRFTSLKVRVLDLSRNSWDCSCRESMVKFVEWIQTMKIPKPSNPVDYKHWIAFVDGYNTKCATPAKLKGRRLDSLTRRDLCP